MPRTRKEAPNATVRLNRHKDERRTTELDYDKKYQDRKHFWHDPRSDALKSLVAKGLVEIVKEDEKEVTNGASVLCSMDRERWEATAKNAAETSYEEVKALRGNFDEFDAPLRQFANPKTPRGQE